MPRSKKRLASGSPEAALEALGRLRDTSHPQIRLSQEIVPWLENRDRAAGRQQLRHEYELKVQSGEWPAHETTVPLFPYQREGMLHLAFTERALLADEMGLGKTIQAIAACALLQRLGQARRVLVVTPASLKTEWEEQIRKFTTLDYQIVFGGKLARLKAYATPAGPSARPVPFFTIVNYEQMVADALDVNERLAPDIVVLDEAQRIKNWNTKTAQAVKRLRSRYAFVLTGTPIENRIDELHSLMDFLNPAVLGPLFRFNRDFYELDDRGRPVGYRNLDELRRRIHPFLLRRRKAEVETELPPRSDRNHFVPLNDRQKSSYAGHEQQVLKLVNIAQRRPLTQQEQEKLQRELAMMRMICDTNFILDPDDRTCPKLAEIEKLLEECGENDTKVIIFSEWEKMLQLVRGLCDERGLGYAWHTGSVPATAPPRRNQRVQGRSPLPRLSQHRRRRDRPEPPERQRGHQLRPAVEPGQAGTAHRPRLAQTADPARDRHQFDFRKHHRAPDARNARPEIKRGRQRAGPARQGEGNQTAQRTAGRGGALAATRHAATPGDRPAARRHRSSPAAPPIPRWLLPNSPPNASTGRWSAAKSGTRKPARIRFWWWWWTASRRTGASS